MKELKELTFEKACKLKKLDAKKVIPAFPLFPKRDRKSMQSHAKLVIMVSAANQIANDGKPWFPDYDNGSQPKYEPRFYKGSSGFRFLGCADWAFGFARRLSPLLYLL